MDYWNSVNEEDFDIYYSYEPEIMYIETMPLTGDASKLKNNFRIHALPKWAGSSSAPGAGTQVTNSFSPSMPRDMIAIPPEILSTHTNLFIAIGDGDIIKRELDVKTKQGSGKRNVFEFDGTWTNNSDGSKQTTSDAAIFSFEEVMDKFKVDLTDTEKKIEVYKQVGSSEEKIYFEYKKEIFTSMTGITTKILEKDPIAETIVVKKNGKYVF
jgi:hypothetical protein